IASFIWLLRASRTKRENPGEVNLKLPRRNPSTFARDDENCCAILNFQLFRKPRENSRSIFFHNHCIFDPRSADSRVIQTGLDRETLSRLQHDLLQTRIFVNFEPKTVPGPVKKSDTAPITHFRGKATPFE